MIVPKITTIIPTFKRPRLLKRAIESVLTQSFKNFEIHIYDNASGDETEEIVAEYIQRDKRIFYFKNEKNIGALNNIIQGIRSVNTEFYSILSDDDFILPKFYENAIHEFEECPLAGFVCAKTLTVDIVNEQMQFRNRDWSPGFYQPSKVIASKMYNSHFVSTGVLFRQRVRYLVGEFEASGNDVLFMTMAAAIMPFVVVKDYGAVFSMHAESYSANGGMLKEEDSLLNKNLLATIQSVMKLELHDEIKVHLLILTVKTYRKALEPNFQQKLPKQTYASKLVFKVYQISPKIIHSLLSRCINLLRLFKTQIFKKESAEWSELPLSAKFFLLNSETDINKFLPCLITDQNKDWFKDI